MPCGCSDNKKLNIENIKNIPIDDIIRLYRDGYRLESSTGPEPSLESSIMSRDQIGNIAKLSPEVTLIYSEGYEQADGVHMTIDVLVRNPDPSPLVVQFKVYSTDATPIFCGSYTACIQPYSIPQNANGCTKVRIPDLLRKDPYWVYVHRCINTPNCATPSCVQFQTAWDTSCLAEVKTYGGVVPPLDSFPPAGVVKCWGGTLNMTTDCASCTPSWVCELPLNGYEYDSCTQQRRPNPVACAPQIPASRINITTDSVSPFLKGQIVSFYGTLESAISPYPNIPGADVLLTIDVGGAEVVRIHLTTLSGETTPNWSYNWTVPATLADVDTAGMPIAVTVYFAQTAEYQSSTTTADYAVAGARCTKLGVIASKTTANVGEKITITALTEPTDSPFPVIINLDGQRLGTCGTIPVPRLSPMRSRSSLGINSGISPDIRSLQDTISILNAPATAAAGQTINLQISYSLALAWWGEWLRFRICSGGVEIGWKIDLMFGNVSGTTSVDATIPAGATGTISVIADVTAGELSSTCGTDYIFATSSPVNISIVSQVDQISIANPPTSVIAGQTVDLWLDHFIRASWWGEWMRFRICSGSTEIGHGLALLFGDVTSTIRISASIPSDATGTITIRAESSRDELSAVCGDPETIVTSASRTISVVSQSSGTISLVELPAAVRPGQAVDFKVAYNLSLDWYGEWLRFRICSGSTEIGHSKILKFGDVSGTETVNAVIPVNASGTVAIKAEVSRGEDDPVCGSDVLAASSIADIPIYTAQPGSCQITWDTTGASGGIHYVMAEVLGQCSTQTPLAIILTAPPAPCTSISMGIDNPSPVVGDIVLLTAIVQPWQSPLEVTFRANQNIIGTGCITSAGRCTTNWNTGGLAPGAYILTVSIEGQCISIPLEITLASTTPTCTSVSTPNANPGTATIGGTVTLTATVQPTTAVFSVAFKDQNDNIIGTVNTTNGVATYQWNTTGKTAGTYNIKAHIGTLCVSPAAIPVTLNTAVACTSVTEPTANPATVTVGQVVTMSATVQPTTSNYTVDFKDQNNNVLGSANTTNGVATLQWNTTGKSAGTYNVKAYTGSCSSPTAKTVTLNPVTGACTSVSTPTADPATVTIGGTVTLIVTVQPTTSIFNVSFKDQNNALLGSANTLNGVATFAWNTIGKTAGTYNIKGYADSCVSPTATTVTLNTPTAPCTSVTIPSATPTTVIVGQVITLSATVEPTTTTYTVDFKDQFNKLIGSANTGTGGVASYVWNTSGTPAAAYNIKAYVGTMCVSSSPVGVTIAPSTATCTSVTKPIAFPTSVAVGQTLGLRATVQPTTSIFTVDFKDQNNNVIGTANTSSGVATYNWNTTGKTAGSYQIKAYTGTCSSPTAETITLTAGTGVGSITFEVTDAGTPLAGVEIIVDGVSRGTTGSNGRLPSPVSGLTLGITHLWTATKTGYPDQSGSKLLNTDTTITIDMSAPPQAGGGGMMVAIAGLAAAAFFMMRKPPTPK